MIFAQYNTIVSAEILMEENTEFISLTAKATNISEVIQELRYVFTVIEKNEDGSVDSNTKQENIFTLDSFKSELLSETTIDKPIQKEIIVLLLIYNNDDSLLGKARWAQNEKKGNKPLVISKEEFKDIGYDDTLLQGVVTEDTRTKAGRDFYRIFFQEQYNNGLNANDIITVKEFIAGRRNTRIEVRLGNTLVSNFFLQPKEDYLKRMSTITLSNIVRTIYIKEQESRQIERY